MFAMIKAKNENAEIASNRLLVAGFVSIGNLAEQDAGRKAGGA
jgi:hypothetical protein